MSLGLRLPRRGVVFPFAVYLCAASFPSVAHSRVVDSVQSAPALAASASQATFLSASSPDPDQACRDAWQRSVAKFGCQGAVSSARGGDCVIRGAICRSKINLSFPDPGPREVYATRVADLTTSLVDFSDVRLCIYFPETAYTPRYTLRVSCVMGESAPWSGWRR